MIPKLEKSPLEFSDNIVTGLLDSPHLGIKLADLAQELDKERTAWTYKQAESSVYRTTEKRAGYVAGMHVWMEASKRALNNSKTPAGVLLIAMKNVLGSPSVVWEPDTIWVELENNEGVQVPNINRDKLMAAITLLEVPAFYWEVNTFENTTMAFNHVLSNPDRIQEASPSYLAWAVYEAELILHEHQQWQPTFDYEPALYAAECVHRNGMVVAPKFLSFCQESLDSRNGSGASVTKKQVIKAWEKLDKQTLREHEFTETPLDIQLAKLAAVEVYVEDQADKYTTALQALNKA